MDGLSLLMLGSVVFLLFGILRESTSPEAMMDFRALYADARCLLHDRDPYNRNDVLREYSEAEKAPTTLSARDLLVIGSNAYPPTEFVLTAPFALLPFKAARALWLAVSSASILAASLLIWNLVAERESALAGGLIGFYVACSLSLLYFGNPGGIAVSLCVIGAACVASERNIALGILCLALSLAIKPQDTGFVCLLLVLAGGSYRKNGLRALGVVSVLGVAAATWMWSVSPHWIEELLGNVQALMAHGSVNDPTNPLGQGTCTITDLQMVFSVLWDNPKFYNTASYLVCAPLFLAWAIAAVRKPATRKNLYFGLAAISPMTMLPVYHRQYDAKLILLAVPACFLLWARRGRTGRIALVMTAAGMLVTADLPWAFFLAALPRIDSSGGWMAGKTISAVLAVPTPLVLLAMSGFYLWVYARDREAS